MASEQNNLSQYDADTVPSGKHLRVTLVVSEWNSEITEGLYQGAYNTLQKHGVVPEKIHRINVPGSFELVFGCKLAQKTSDIVIAIGSVIQGETRHFDFVCQGVTHGITMLNTNAYGPVIFCVLTDATWQQAKDRSGGMHGNKGVEAAVAALKMAALHQS